MEEIQSNTSKQSSLSNWLCFIKKRVEFELIQQLDNQDSIATTLQEAMRYSLVNGGKRIRAALIYSLQDIFNMQPRSLDVIAVAIEMVHASSLIHDDLPALDNDALRRGKPACHIVYGEAMAVLAGDALLNLSHQVILNAECIEATKRIQLANILANAIGSQGMIGGQSLEFQEYDNTINEQVLLKIYELKTASLLSASIEMVLCLSDVPKEQCQFFKQFAYHVGLAFQIYDDILDKEVSTESLGKPQNSDEKNHKMTLVALVGLSESKKHLQYHHHQALLCLQKTGFSCEKLEQIAEFIITRKF